jgi:4-alpha-glucanotransferase
MVPLFAAPSTRSWGCGEIGDVAPLTRWLGGAGQGLLQLLPLNEMASGHHSPYSALSAMAIDPIYISLPDVPEFERMGGMDALAGADRDALTHAQRSPRVEYGIVGPIKHRTLRAAFEHFVGHDWRDDTARAAALRDYCAREAWWLDDYALFRVLHDREDSRLWTEWPDGVRQRAPEALLAARDDNAREVLFYQYIQWLGGTQWSAARQAAREHGVALFGDLPFMVDLHSADVWMHQDCFHLDRSVGVPPDAFSATGQDWGMPAYNWDALAARDFNWLRERARRGADLFDGYRVDHLVGFYRTFSRLRSDKGDARFSPDRQPAQLALGEQLLRIFREHGAEVVAEDLGTVPDFVRASLALLGVPGFRVFRWERHWSQTGQPFRDPAEYPIASVATTGTHDTETLAVWWESASEEERRAVSAVPTVSHVASRPDLASAAFDPDVRDAVLEAISASASNILIVPIQDVFGWRDRINAPATVSDDNWTYRLPWPSDRLDEQPSARERQATLRAWAGKHRRI